MTRTEPRTDRDLEELVPEILDRVAEPEATVGHEVRRRDRHSNQVLEVHLRDGRILVIKAGIGPGAMARFRTSAHAARLARDRAGLAAPRHLAVRDLGERPVLVYWWLPGPTLEELLAGAGDAERRRLLVDWGELVARLHGIALPAYGPLPPPQVKTTLGEFLERDLGERLAGAVAHHLPEGSPTLDRLLDAVRETEARCRGPATLVHCDLFDRNVLCRDDGGEARCVGLLDFEDAFAGPAEADLAKAEVLHGPLFGQPWDPSWLEPFLEGYGRSPEGFLVGYFRAWHLLNMGFHAALSGWQDHALQVARVAAAEVGSLGSGRSHYEVAARAEQAHTRV